MVRRRILAAMLSVTAAGGAGAALAIAGDGDPPGPPRTVTNDGRVSVQREVSDPWALFEVGRDGRNLALVYTNGGCQGPGRPVVRESATSIRIAVRSDETVEFPPGMPAICPRILRLGRLQVRLAQPVGGRRVVGGPRLEHVRARTRTVGRRTFTLVPRVVGLRASDAVEVLQLQGFHGRTSGRSFGRRRVVAQSPRAGAPAKRTKAPERYRPVTLRLR